MQLPVRLSDSLVLLRSPPVHVAHSLNNGMIDFPAEIECRLLAHLDGPVFKVCREGDHRSDLALDLSCVVMQAAHFFALLCDEIIKLARQSSLFLRRYRFELLRKDKLILEPFI